ncbi:chorismate synthase [Paracrocinitomix mangrovi]|uniref:chorismate synthase n=1 Tax=Paracrocinitomix mangrovi TaxID=2862509 RepID=UPI001C8DD6C1|nr:chorismate synthase [Paracrocinitomix mangrovi]UKN02524.1 chorismate synthase [Paracrocinitomix mangrovi]
MNSFGDIFRLTTFGESHGKAIGGIIDGCPANIKIDIAEVQKQLDRRKPGQSSISTQRKEEDTVDFLSGLFEGKTLGTPIGFIIPNKDQKSKDYGSIKDQFRPSHADFTYQEKYGIRDYRGGGRSSARETACRVVAGAIAQQILANKGIKIQAFVNQIAHLQLTDDYHDIDLNRIDDNIVRCPSAELADEMIEFVKSIKKQGDSVGGVVKCRITGTPVGLGAPVFDKLNADLAKAMFSINAVKGFELGSGFGSVLMKGSEHNDEFEVVENKIKTKTNFSGGIQGGISNGEDIYFNVAFKPVATIFKKQNTVDKLGNEVEMQAEGRHDPCVVPRAVPIVESMAALVMLDHLLKSQTVHI